MDQSKASGRLDRNLRVMMKQGGNIRCHSRTKVTRAWEDCQTAHMYRNPNTGSLRGPFLTWHHSMQKPHLKCEVGPFNAVEALRDVCLWRSFGIANGKFGEWQQETGIGLLGVPRVFCSARRPTTCGPLQKSSKLTEKNSNLHRLVSQTTAGERESGGESEGSV